MNATQLDGALFLLANLYRDEDPMIATCLFTILGAKRAVAMPALFEIVAAFATEQAAELVKLQALDKVTA